MDKTLLAEPKLNKNEGLMPRVKGPELLNSQSDCGPNKDSHERLVYELLHI